MEMHSTKSQSWWMKYGVWSVLGACLACVLMIPLVLVGAAVAFGVVVAGAVSKGIKTSEPYTLALAKARANAAVIETLGEPITDGPMPSGSIKSNGGSGEVDLAIPVSGPRGSGTIYVVARQEAGVWTYSTLAVAVGGQEKCINLLSSGQTARDTCHSLFGRNLGSKPLVSCLHSSPAARAASSPRRSTK